MLNDTKKDLTYWHERLLDYNGLHLPIDKLMQKNTIKDNNCIDFEIDSNIINALMKLSLDLNVNLYSIFLVAYYLLLSVYSNQHDIVIGVHGSKFPIRINIQENEKLISFIKRLDRDLDKAEGFADFEIEKLIYALDLEHIQSHHPLFQAIFDIQDSQTEVFDISLKIDKNLSFLKGFFVYRCDVFSDECISNYSKTYLIILKQLSKLSKNNSLKINDLRYVSDETFSILVNKFNKTNFIYENKKTIHQLFEDQVTRTPNNIALVYKNKKITYGELNEESNQLARYLKQIYRIENNDLICLCLDRNEKMLVAILGVLKAGGAYVPIDPSYPDERKYYILHDTNSKLVLTNTKYAQTLKILTENKKIQTKIELLDNVEFNLNITDRSKENLNEYIHANNLAYVIYTSGTTGNPKGVMIEHTSVVNLITFEAKAFNLKVVDKYDSDKSIQHCLWYANYVFDAHVWEIYVSLVNGHLLHLIDDPIRQDLSLLAEYIIANNIYLATIPPALLTRQTLLPVRYLVVAGDKTDSSVLDYYSKNNVHIINAYGPTESTVCCSVNRFVNNGADNIGHPIFNTKLYVLNKELQPLPVGAVGELYVGGKGLARGYLNQRSLTEEKFILNPFQTKQEKITGEYEYIYKTGDLVKFTPSVDLEFIGRSDGQVKLNGLRIELEEIQVLINSFSGIRKSVVIIKNYSQDASINNKFKYIVAYYIADKKFNEADLKKYLSLSLPKYMIPSSLICLDKLPLTINGKLDVRSLPDPRSKADFVEPTNVFESDICKLYADALELSINQVGMNANFIELGGNSILAANIAAKLSKLTNRSIKTTDVMMIDSISELVKLISSPEYTYKPITKLNSSNAADTLFMIHPGFGGCEAYSELAFKLQSKFNCYGIENYNLYNDDKIYNLVDLVDYYIHYITEYINIDNKNTLYILGFCIGGLIALEIAAQFEMMGFENIKVILLDTSISDDRLRDIRSADEYKKIHDVIYDLKKAHLTPDALKKTLNAIEPNIAVMDQNVSKKLDHTDVILFKCGKADNLIDLFKNEYEHIVSLPYNNIEVAHNNINKIERIILTDVMHNDIINQVEVLEKYMNTNLIASHYHE